MSLDFSISTVLDLPFTKNHIAAILKRGSEIGFVYYDHIIGQSYEDAPILNHEQASDKIMNAVHVKIEGGPSIYTKIEEDSSYAYIWFYETDEGYLEIYLGGFGSPKRKNYYLDFAHYIRIILSLCNDYIILSLCTSAH